MLGLLGAFGAVSCLPDRAGCGHPADPRSGSPSLDLVADVALPPAYAADVLWLRAAQGDDFDSARLGRQESAESLFTALSQGGRLGRTALDALAYAPDRDAVLGRTCELTTQATAATTSLLLASILSIVETAPHTEASVDGAGSAACTANLRRLSERQGQSPSDRDLAQSALSRLAARSVLLVPSR